jgi:glycosyltransferase involved in cell wall biosynthesis
MWNGKTLAVVLPTYNEKDSIAETIRLFEGLGIVDDVLVINNNAAPGTSAEVATTHAREIVEIRQGYGAAIKRGLREVDADLVCVCEPDGTFNPADLYKLLPFTTECDLVIGSRTVSAFIWEGANMGTFLRWGNWAVAKLAEVLNNSNSLSDVGCTFRVMRRPLAADIVAHETGDGSSFGLEMMLLTIILRKKLVQIPVNYHPRIGVSSVTGDLRKATALGLRMIRMIIRMRLQAVQIRRRAHRQRLSAVQGTAEHPSQQLLANGSDHALPRPASETADTTVS